MTTLYRYFDKTGQLLYVGHSIQPFARLMAHLYGAAWAQEIARVELEHFESRLEASIAEARAIELENPLYNLEVSAPRKYTRREKKPTKAEALAKMKESAKMINLRRILR